MSATHSAGSSRAFIRRATGWSCAQALVIVGAGAAFWAATVVIILKL